jgi:acyl-CoA synthetase (AMP-forming)/AMP-acid ligase II
LKKGDVIAFLVSNRAEIVEIFFALARTGIIGLPLNYRLADTELVELCRSMKATALIYESRFAGAAAHIGAAIPEIRHMVAIGERRPPHHDYEELLAAERAEAPDIEIEDDDPFYFNLTSGTTGLPKSYLLNHYNNSTIVYAFDAVDMTKRDRVMTVFPIFGRVGFSWIIGSFLQGAPNVLANFDATQVLSLIETERVTVVNLVPTMATLLLQAREKKASDLSSLRAIIFTGASLPPTVRDQTMAQLCPDIYEYYGMNEMGLLFLSRPADRKRQPDSVGKPILFSEVKIVDDEGGRLGPNSVGEILGRSPLTATGYYDSPQKSAETFRDGWLHTGDLGYLDEEGYLFISGRKKDMIVSGGQNVFPSEIEDVLLRADGVADCAVIGLPDPFWGERVVGVVILHRDAEVTAEQLDGFCRQYLASFKVPKDFIFETTPLPRTPTGKVQKFLLIERFSTDGTLAGGASVA